MTEVIIGKVKLSISNFDEIFVELDSGELFKVTLNEIKEIFYDGMKKHYLKLIKKDTGEIEDEKT